MDVHYHYPLILASWTDSNGNSILDPCALGEGVYSLNLIDDDGCETNENFTVNQPDSLAIELISFEYSNGFNLSDFQSGDGEIDSEVTGGTGSYLYSWSSGQSTPDINELDAEEYILTITDDQGCVSTNSILLTEPNDLALPSGFTPNADESNDFYVVQGLDQYDNVEIVVFNRWGNKVYTMTNYDNSWNGQNDNGEDLADGTYYVIAMATKNGESTELNSFVDLRR